MKGSMKGKIRQKDCRLINKRKMKLNDKCLFCGGIKNVWTHHISYNPDPNKVSDIIMLCGNCHKKFHWLERKIHKNVSKRG